MDANVSSEAAVMTDSAQLYKYRLGPLRQPRPHRSQQGGICPLPEGRPVIHTNTVEGYFSVFKRGMRGVYQHCKEKHLHRYLAEFDFRYNARKALGVDDEQRAAKMSRVGSAPVLSGRRSLSYLLGRI